MVLFCAAINRDSVSLFKFPFVSHVQIILCTIIPVYQLFFFPFLFLRLFKFLFMGEFFTSALSLSLSLSDSFSLNILANFNNDVVWMVSIFPWISSLLSLFSRSLETVPRARITIGITITFMFHSFFSSLARSRFLSSFSFCDLLTLWN